MKSIDQKRNELAAVNVLLNRMGRMTKRQISKLNDASKKMMLNNLNDLMARKVQLLNEIVACQA